MKQDLLIKTRNTAKAIIFDGPKVLLLRKEYEDGQTAYTLPGGGQEPGETLEEAVIREVHEEVAAHIQVLGLANIYEHRRASRSKPHITRHKVEFAFVCKLIEPYQPAMGHHPDPHQVAVEWIETSLLSSIALYPQALEKILVSCQLTDFPVYLGETI
jgi:ADP-ribose pyrophosphatase YjhB (NUDIX family)